MSRLALILLLGGGIGGAAAGVVTTLVSVSLSTTSVGFIPPWLGATFMGVAFAIAGFLSGLGALGAHALLTRMRAAAALVAVLSSAAAALIGLACYFVLGAAPSPLLVLAAGLPLLFVGVTEVIVGIRRSRRRSTSAPT